MNYLREYILLVLNSWVISITAKQWISSTGMCEYNIEIVDIHNELRRSVAKGELYDQPKARNMQKIAWDDRLARKARDFADKMVLQHNPARHELQYWVGENMMITRSTAPSSNNFEWKRVINKWFGDHIKFQYGPVASDTRAGSYLQIVWADTKFIGCGGSYFKDNGWYNKLYICYYAPAGNIESYYPYKTGNGCENLCCNDIRCRSIYGHVCQGRKGEVQSVENDKESNVYDDESNTFGGRSIEYNARRNYNVERNDTINYDSARSNDNVKRNDNNNDYLSLSEAGTKPDSDDIFFHSISSVPLKKSKADADTDVEEIKQTHK